jgi:hypothetical protein
VEEKFKDLIERLYRGEGNDVRNGG